MKRPRLPCIVYSTYLYTTGALIIVYRILDAAPGLQLEQIYVAYLAFIIPFGGCGLVASFDLQYRSVLDAVKLSVTHKY